MRRVVLIAELKLHVGVPTGCGRPFSLLPVFVVGPAWMTSEQNGNANLIGHYLLHIYFGIHQYFTSSDLFVGSNKIFNCS